MRGTFLGLFCCFSKREICEQAHEGLHSETCMEMGKEEVGEQRKKNYSFPCLFIDFAFVPDFYLHLLYELVSKLMNLHASLHLSNGETLGVRLCIPEK